MKCAINYCMQSSTFQKIGYPVPVLYRVYIATLKIHKKSNFDQNLFEISTIFKYVYMHQKKIIKMETSLLVIFDEIWPKSLYYSTGSLARFWSNFKNL